VWLHFKFAKVNRCGVEKQNVAQILNNVVRKILGQVAVIQAYMKELCVTGRNPKINSSMTATPIPDSIWLCPAQSYCCIRPEKSSEFLRFWWVTSSVKRRGTKRYPKFQNGPSLSAVRNYSITTSLHKWTQHRHWQPESDACSCGLGNTKHGVDRATEHRSPLARHGVWNNTVCVWRTNF